MRCLWCEKEILIEVNWGNFLYPDQPKNLCVECESQLVRLEGELCTCCGRMSKEKVCSDCQRWESNPEWKGIVTYNRSVYTYNEMLQAVITKWKYRGDYVLAEMFKQPFEEVFKQSFDKTHRQAILVPIPLSKERLYERGFNQAESLAKQLELPVQHALTRIHGEKQSKKTRRDRLGTKNPFKTDIVITGPVILIDDLYTTGTTLRHAAKTLRESGCPKVSSFTLARG